MAATRKKAAKKTSAKKGDASPELPLEKKEEPKKRKPRKPIQTIELMKVFAVVEEIDVGGPDKEEIETGVLDVFFDKGSADFVCMERIRVTNEEHLEAVTKVSVEKIEALVVRTKTGSGRGKKPVEKIDVYILDQDVRQPMAPETSEHAKMAAARRSAIEKMSPMERKAFGIEE